ncbi:flavin reductase [Nocardioides panaciterrulae]|uniref:Flavin reductase (DIM6/NTAB) family NADH-FMN oxidoreductase RutF n=1 Tax=Nocardioides panaciterrulae TaxID=661492 RepID=A0A7Y9E6V9_9ACTN|nr:flavin reductase (DIM6/NTAB) family NADH-FMN oxidoreductase RutF [Nocardioides panaciterrulae]
MTIHSEHPFLDPDPDPVRRFRGRLGGAVTLWTAADARGRAGLTVSSLMVAAGEPARVLALLDPDSDLAETLQRSERAVVSLLTWEQRGLADAFAGVAPAPGGAFRMAEFEDTAWGPRLVTDGSWAGVVLESTTEVGWSALVSCTVEHVEIGADEAALVHRRGRYARAER